MHSRQDIVRLYTPSLCFVALLRARLHHWALKHLVRASTLGHTHKQRMCMDSGGFLRLNHCGARVISGKPAEQPMESGFQYVPGCLSAKQRQTCKSVPSCQPLLHPLRGQSLVMHRGKDCQPRAAPSCRRSHCAGPGESRSWLGRSQTWSPAQRPSQTPGGSWP